MALRKDALKEKVASDARDLSRPTAPKRERMRVYQMKFDTATMERFRAYCVSKGLSLASGARLAIAEYMEKQGI